MVQVGDTIHNRYHVIQELGKGGFAKTFLVKDIVHSNDKVIKILERNAYSNQKVLELFKREYNTLTEFDHPGIPRVDVGAYLNIVDTDQPNTVIPALVMEKIDGENLQQWLDRNGKVSNTQQATEWLKQLVDILDYVHRHRYVHRDIKPHNIMLKPDGQLVLIDFGIVKELTQQIEKQTITHTQIGTPGYAAPEQENATLQTLETSLENFQLDHRADFFSLGRTFVHLLTGISPNNLRTDPQTGNLLWRDQVLGIDEGFKDLIDWLMVYNPKRRPQSTRQIKQRIKDLLEIESPVRLPIPIAFFSLTLNFVLLTLLAMGVPLIPGWKVLFVVVLCVISVFFVKPLMKYFW